MRTAIALTLIVSGLIVRVCLNLHHLLVQPSLPNSAIIAEQEIETMPAMTASVKEEPKDSKMLPSRIRSNPPAALPVDNQRTTVYAEAKFSEHCQQGDARSCQAELLQKKKWCEEGNLIDCNTLAWMYFQGAPGIKADQIQAIALFDNVCNRGGRIACTSLGMIYKEGKGSISKDESKSIEYWKKNCTTNNATNCYELALSYYDGKGTLADKDNVVPLMLQSCDENHAAACKWLVDNNITEIAPSPTALTLK